MSAEIARLRASIATLPLAAQPPWLDLCDQYLSLITQVSEDADEWADALYAAWDDDRLALVNEALAVRLAWDTYQSALTAGRPVARGSDYAAGRLT